MANFNTNTNPNAEGRVTLNNTALMSMLKKVLSLTGPDTFCGEVDYQTVYDAEDYNSVSLTPTEARWYKLLREK